MKALLIILFVCSAFVIAGNPGAGQIKTDTIKVDRLDSLEKRMDTTETSLKISETKLNISEALIKRNKNEAKEVRRLAWNLKKKSLQAAKSNRPANEVVKSGTKQPEQMPKESDPAPMVINVYEAPKIKDTMTRVWYKPPNENGLLKGWNPFKFLKRNQNNEKTNFNPRPY